MHSLLSLFLKYYRNMQLRKCAEGYIFLENYYNQNELIQVISGHFNNSMKIKNYC